MLSDDIQTVNSLICKSDPSQAELDAWQRIKTATVKLNTTPNNESAHYGCPECGVVAGHWYTCSALNVTC
jgi:hypothetical protein